MTVRASPAASAAEHGNRAAGYACGAIMALGASISFVAARAGVLGGLAPDDMIFARYVVAGAILLPVLVRWGVPTLAGIGWPRGLALLLTGGPLFAILQTGGYAFAPLAHGAVIAPSTVTILSTVVAAGFMGERLTRAHLVGTALVLAGIALIGWHGLAASSGADTWIGDVMFAASSVLWAGFTVLLRLWRVDAIRATAVVGVLSLVAAVPVYLAHRGFAHVADLPVAAIVVQGVVQGIVQGVITIMAYGQTVVLLGVSRAVLFPAIVPAITIVIGIPMIGEAPEALQVGGLALVSVGLLLAVGLLGYRPARAVAAKARAHGTRAA